MSATEVGVAWAGQRVNTVHAVIPGEKNRELTGTVVRAFSIGRTVYLVIERPDGVQGTAPVASVVPA